jgi:hypothetical protein
MSYIRQEPKTCTPCTPEERQRAAQIIVENAGKPVKRIRHTSDIRPMVKLQCPPLPQEQGHRVCGSTFRELLPTLIKALPVNGDWMTCAAIAKKTGWSGARVGRVALACPLSVWASKDENRNGQIMYRRTPGLCEKNGA